VLAEIESLVGKERLAEVCGTAPAAGFLIATLRWLQRYDPARLDRIGAILLPKDYVRFKITGEIATDASDAAATGLFDVAGRTWAWEIIEILGLPRTIFVESCCQMPPRNLELSRAYPLPPVQPINPLRRLAMD
jgi:xylulokinase